MPGDAEAVFVSVVAAAPLGPGNFKAVPQGVTPPVAGGGVVNFQNFSPVTMLNSNAVVIGLTQPGVGGQLDVYANVGGSDVRGVVHGYYRPAEEDQD